MSILTHGSLFSGIGGFDLAAEWAGWTNVFHCEINPFGQKILKQHFPDSINHEDITKTDFNAYRGGLDVLTGGFPCQDISISGINNGRKGLKGSRSGLFYQMLRAIDEIQPRYIIYENSPMVSGPIAEIIHHELKNLNYVNWAKIITARHYGFPHKRARYYGVSFTNSNGFGWDAFRYFNIQFEKIYQSEEVFRLSKANKTEFIRTLSPSLRSKADTQYVRSTDGISDKLDKDRITALGNAVVPLIPYQIFKAINEYESQSVAK